MLKSESIALLASALAKAHADFVGIKRDKTVRVATKAGGFYTFSYAPLDSIMAAIRPALSQHELVLVQSAERADHGDVLRTTLLHGSGEWIANDTRIIGGGGGPQEYGSALTYASRYGISRLLCLASEEDDDGNLASGNSAEVLQARPPAKKTEPVTLPVPITAEQALEIRQLLNELNVAELDFCKFLAVPDIDSIPGTKLANATAAIAAKQNKVKRAAAAAAAEEVA